MVLKISFSTLSIFFLFFHGYAQTTIEEYNYLTKGYKIQQESGLDMKKGYKIQFLTEHRVLERTQELHVLFRDGETKPCAFLVVYERPSTRFKDYICIPHFDSDSEIWLMFWEKVQTYSDNGTKALVWGLSKLAAYNGK